MKQPVIGISPGIDVGIKYTQSASTHYLRRTYTEMLASVGALPIILNIDMPLGAVLSLCDGIVIAGGEDIDPELYKEAPTLPPGALIEPQVRVDWERQLIDACDEVGMPILGICFGMQLLNIHYGGTLYQDIATEIQLPDSIDHELTTHDVRFSQDFLGYKLGDVRPIASRHHQAVDTIPEQFSICATAPDGIVEAFRSDRHFGIQWHPESDLTGVHVYRAFAEHCAPHLVVSSNP